jgi:sn-glycerol 3-phosphate transport system permease protein
MGESVVTEGTSSVASVPRSSRRWRTAKATVEGLLYLAPTFLILGIFTFVPIITSFRLSLNRIAPFGNQMRFVGLDNYTRLLSEPEYWETVRVSLIFTIGTVLIGIALAVALAIALSYPMKRLSWFHRLLIFVPIVISTAVTGVLFRWIYHPVVGYLNYVLSLMGIEGPNWLGTKDWALIAVILAVIWRQLGFNVIIALAGIQNIDGTFYEAAKVDGASAWQRIRHITLPLLTPTLFFLLLINTIFSLQTFGEINILTDGGPGRATTNLIYSIFIDAFVGTPLRGFASAQAYLLALMILIISIVQFRGLGRRVHYS